MTATVDRAAVALGPLLLPAAEHRADDPRADRVGRHRDGVGDQPAARHRSVLRPGRPDVRAHAQPRCVERAPPPPRRQPGCGCASSLLVASVATMVGWHTRASSLVAVLMMVVLQRANTAIFNSGDLLLRQVGICVALAPVRPAVVARRAARPSEGSRAQRAPRAVRHALPPAEPRPRLLPVGVDQVARQHVARRHRHRAVAAHRGPPALRRPRVALRPGRPPQPVHLGHARSSRPPSACSCGTAACVPG